MNPAQVATPLTSEKSQRIIHAISRATDAIAWLFCRFVQGQILVELMKRSVVKYACMDIQRARHPQQQQKVTLTELGLHTGLDTRSLRKIMEEPLRATEENICAEAAILSRWAKDPALRSADTGKPMDLPIFGVNGTFEGLVLRYAGRGISVRFVLQRLEQMGNVRTVNKHWVRLVNPNWVFFENDEDALLSHGVNSVAAIGKALENNLAHQKQPDKKWVERRVFSLRIPPERRAEAAAMLNRQLKKQWAETRELIRSYEVEATHPTDEILGVGYYFWRDDLYETVSAGVVDETWLL